MWRQWGNMGEEERSAGGVVEARRDRDIPGHVSGVGIIGETADRHDHASRCVNYFHVAAVHKNHYVAVVGIDRGDGAVLMVGRPGQTVSDSIRQTLDCASVLRVHVSRTFSWRWKGIRTARRRAATVARREMDQSAIRCSPQKTASTS